MFEKTLELTPNYTVRDAQNLYRSLISCLPLAGDVAECGVFNGGTAHLISKIVHQYTHKHIYLFDSFQGLPFNLKTELDPDLPGKYKGDLESVKLLLNDFSYATIFEGLFSETLEKIAEKRFCFVHLDVDYIKSYRQCYEFFWPRLVQRGKILADDCFIEKSGVVYDGVWRLTRKLFNGVDARIIRLGRQCVIVKK